METRIVSSLNPVYSELYLGALRAQGLRVYIKELNIDAWIRVEIYLVYDDPRELAQAQEIIKGLEE